MSTSFPAGSKIPQSTGRLQTRILQWAEDLIETTAAGHDMGAVLRLRANRASLAESTEVSPVRFTATEIMAGHHGSRFRLGVGRATSRRRGFLTLALALVIGLPGGSAFAAKKPLPEACPGGRFPIAGEALVPGGVTPDAIVIDGSKVSIDSGCVPTTARRKRLRGGTRLLARWASCGTLRGPVQLVVKLDAGSCESLSGRFSGRKVRRTLATAAAIPPNAYSRVRDPLPAGAVMVSQTEWNQATTNPDFRSIDPTQIAADRAAAERAAAADAQTVREYVAQHPGLAPQLLGGVDPTDPSVSPGDDGGYLHMLVDGAGNRLTISTLGSKARFQFLAPSLREFPTRENQTALYTQFYEGLAGIDPVLAAQYPSPDQARTFGLVDLRGLNDQLAKSYGQYLAAVPRPGGRPPPGYPLSCDREEGAGAGTDRESLCTHTSGGVWNNYVWGLKWPATCVKQQGARGTCWAFATVAATELWAAKKYGRWLNLSEQHLVFKTKHIWYPSTFGDSGGPPFEKIIDTGYRFPFESLWAYNPSYSRAINAAAMTYQNSCVGYAGVPFCSDTNHQGELICADFGLFRFCGAIPPASMTDSGLAPTSYVWFWDPTEPDNSFATLIWALAIFQKPIVVAFPVTPSFDNPDGDGFITYRGPHCAVDSAGTCKSAPGCECDRGGHIALVTGLIDNTQLPHGAPAGDGGGYIIMKNSWGTCYGDGGYVYVPYTWFKKMVGAAAVVGDIN